MKTSKWITLVAIIILSSNIMIASGGYGANSPQSFDVLIKNGKVYDGSTAAPCKTNIGIKGDRIVALGKNITGPAAKTIDARGLIVTPGFIDVHNHTDLYILMRMLSAGKDAALSATNSDWRNNHNYSTQGVTTIVTGLCGAGLPDIDEWLGMIKSQRFASNVYHLIPYGMLRYRLFGDNQPVKLTPEQLATLKNLVEKEMQKGAVGFSVGLEYAPDCFTTTDELVEIAKVVRKYGGLYDAHIRAQTGIIQENGLPSVLNAMKETVEIGRRAKIPVHISHIQLNLPWNNVQAGQIHEIIIQARSAGVDITADQHPYEAGYAILSYRLPDKYKTGLGVNKKFKNPEGKAEMMIETKKIFDFLPPEKIRLTSGPEKYLNKSIREISEAEGNDPVETYVELSSLEYAPYALFFEISDQVNRELMKYDYVFTASDGFTVLQAADSPHPRFYGCFPRKIKKYAMEEKLLGLNDAIRSMTSLPAQKFKLKDRGMIKVGNYADIAVIDLTRLRENATYVNRSLYSNGIIYLLVNGQLTIDQEKLTGINGGRGCYLAQPPR